MRCHEARDVLSGAMDGREETRAELAMRHVESCPECREWHRGMEKALSALVAAKAAIPSVDLSSAIMASLPARHPASEKVAPALAARKLVLVMATCWVLGAIMMAAVIGVWAYYFGGSPHAVAVSAKASAGAAGSVAKTGWITCRALVSSAMSVVLQILPNATRWIVTLVIVDVLVLLSAAALWRKRRTLAGPFCILS